MALAGWVRGRAAAAVPREGPRPDPTGSVGAGVSAAEHDPVVQASRPMDPSALRQTWAEGSQVCGWAFESDWDTPAVDAVVDAICGDRSVWASAERLGGERAAAGVPLAEALTDVDVLADLVADRHRESLVRAVSLGWADRVIAPADAVSDALTGLASAEYLRIRLGEIYRAAEVEGSSAARSHALVVVRLGKTGSQSWTRRLPMILVGDALRTVFDAGESLARIGPAVAVAVAPRGPLLARRARLMAELIAAGVEESDDDVSPHVWIEGLPETCSAAADLLSDLAR